MNVENFARKSSLARYENICNLSCKVCKLLSFSFSLGMMVPRVVVSVNTLFQVLLMHLGKRLHQKLQLLAMISLITKYLLEMLCSLLIRKVAGKLVTWMTIVKVVLSMMKQAIILMYAF